MPSETTASVSEPTPMTFDDLRRANDERAKQWNPSGKPLGLEFAVIELCGEAGELANAVKKHLRAKAGLVGGVTDDEAVEDETADVVICCDLLARAKGFDLAAAVARKFNKTSRKHGFTVTLPLPGSAPPGESKAGSGLKRFCSWCGHLAGTPHDPACDARHAPTPASPATEQHPSIVEVLRAAQADIVNLHQAAKHKHDYDQYLRELGERAEARVRDAIAAFSSSSMEIPNHVRKRGVEFVAQVARVDGPQRGCLLGYLTGYAHATGLTPPALSTPASPETWEDKMLDALEAAWGVIANAGSIWGAEDGEWRAAAERWRDNMYHPLIQASRLPPDAREQERGEDKPTPPSSPWTKPVPDAAPVPCGSCGMTNGHKIDCPTLAPTPPTERAEDRLPEGMETAYTHAKGIVQECHTMKQAEMRVVSRDDGWRAECARLRAELAEAEKRAEEMLAFLKRSADGKHRIVSSGDLTTIQQADAQADRRFYVEPGGGLGWALLPWHLRTPKDKEREEARQ